jgi:DNA-directed RNA polymerase subunit RPC12/RpoP
MGDDYKERDYDDEVYEDDYYEENYNEEELIDSEDVFEDDDDEFGDEKAERKIHISYACEDCDYRWDDVIIKRHDEIEEEDYDRDVVCPMCGSVNVTLI